MALIFNNNKNVSYADTGGGWYNPPKPKPAPKPKPKPKRKPKPKPKPAPPKAPTKKKVLASPVKNNLFEDWPPKKSDEAIQDPYYKNLTLEGGIEPYTYSPPKRLVGPTSNLEGANAYDLFGNLGRAIGNWWNNIGTGGDVWGGTDPGAQMRAGQYDYSWDNQHHNYNMPVSPAFANWPPTKSENAVRDPYYNYYQMADDIEPYVPSPLSQAWWPPINGPQQSLLDKLPRKGSEDSWYPYEGYNPRADVDWAMANRAKNTPQDYFDRIVLNGRTYSVPNQMLSFAKDYPWETSPTWYEPPAGWLNTNNEWKEWPTDEGVNSDGSPPVDGGGGGGGGGGGYPAYDTGGFFHSPSSPGYTGYSNNGYYSSPSSPGYRGYSDGYSSMPLSSNWGGGYGSSNYSSKPQYPTQGYRQDPDIYYQNLVKWVI